MPRQLILSVGLHKTGTTSIQHTCARNKDALLRDGFIYPEFLFDRERIDNHTGALHLMFRKEPAKLGFSGARRSLYTDNQAAALRKRFREVIASRVLTQSNNLLMIAEGVSTFSVDEFDDLRSWFNDRGWTVRVICFVRWISSWLNSMVSQRVTGFQHSTISAAVAEFVDAAGVIRPRIANIRTVFPDAQFYSYEAGLRHDRGPVGFFLRAIGVEQTEGMIFARANEGRCDCATRLISSINEALGPRFAEGTENRCYAENRAFIARLSAIPGRRFSLRRDEVSQLMPLIVAENEWLKETLGEQFYDRQLQFSEVPSAWTEQGVARVREVLATATPVVLSLVETYLATLERNGIVRDA